MVFGAFWVAFQEETERRSLKKKKFRGTSSSSGKFSRSHIALTLFARASSYYRSEKEVAHFQKTRTKDTHTHALAHFHSSLSCLNRRKRRRRRRRRREIKEAAAREKKAHTQQTFSLLQKKNDDGQEVRFIVIIIVSAFCFYHRRRRHQHVRLFVWFLLSDDEYRCDSSLEERKKDFCVGCRLFFLFLNKPPLLRARADSSLSFAVHF